MRIPFAETRQLRAEVRKLSTRLSQEVGNNQLLSESVADLERSLNEPGWIQVLANADQEFSPEGLVRLRAICKLYSIKSPLIRRGLNLRSAYVWGRGVEITARANGRQPGEQDVQKVVNDFLTDPANQRAFTGAEARDRLEHAFGTDGELFAVLFTRPTTGQVQVRTIPADQVVRVISNPEDRTEPWYYHRRWIRETLDPETGHVSHQTLEAYYPAVDYRPATRPRQIGGRKVHWDSPVLHIAVNRPDGWDRGIPDAYAAIDWAKAYKEFLEDWARLMRALSRYAWKATTPGRKANAVKARVAQGPGRDPSTGEPQHAGATAVLPPDVQLEAISKSGATIDADSGRPLATMVASALDVPVTMLLADPGQTGARAVAETLDQPTELAMGQRRDLWAAAYQRILLYVITEAVRAVNGPLRGVIRRDSWTGREQVALAGDTDTTIDIDWPDLDDTDVTAVVQAIKTASDTGTVPPEVVLRLLLTALGVRQVDKIVEQLLDDDGNFEWPTGPPLGGGQSAADRQRAGQDPADAGPGSMAPDDEPDDPDAGDGADPDQPEE
ncbi:hypothetical protein ACGFIY_21295 [Micromonospora chersina]|uniref:hypothetical protein n=1 Tax=Micromonospora chersina TaxID=47854 RepID=UPI00371399FC